MDCTPEEQRLADKIILQRLLALAGEDRDQVPAAEARDGRISMDILERMVRLFRKGGDDEGDSGLNDPRVQALLGMKSDHAPVKKKKAAPAGGTP